MFGDGRPRRPVLLVLSVAVAVFGAACSGSNPVAIPVVEPAPSSTTPTTTGAASGTVLTTTSSSSTSTSVRSSTTSTTRVVTAPISIGPGEAFIGGSVIGPAGPVDGAIVRIERLVGTAVAMAEVVSSGGGLWRMDAVLGGAYRLRAFRFPDLSQPTPEVFFLAAGERKTVDLRLTRTGEERITAVITPNPPRVNQSAVLTIQVGSSRIDDQGRAVLIPHVGTVLALSVGSGQVLESSFQVATDTNGTAGWRLRCLVEGLNPITLTIGTGTTPVALPACAAASAPAATPTTQAR